MTSSKVGADVGVHSSEFVGKLNEDKCALIRENRLDAYVPLGIAMLLSVAATAVAVLYFPLSSVAAISLFCVAVVLLCGGIIRAIVVCGRRESQILRLFLGSMKELLEPYWENCKSTWQEWCARYSDEDKKEFPDHVPNDLFQLPIGYDEDTFRRKFLHVAICFALTYESGIITNAEYEALMENFVAGLAILPRREFESLLTVPVGEDGIAVVSLCGKPDNRASRMYCNLFMRAMTKLKIETLRNCYLNLFLSYNPTRFSGLCSYGEDLELLEEILALLADGKYVKLEHLCKCEYGNTILDAATDGYNWKDQKAVCEKIWNFLRKVLPDEDLKKLCLTEEINGNVAILNFLRWQKSFSLREECLKFIGTTFNDVEKDKLFIGDDFLNFIYSGIIYSGMAYDEGNQKRDKIIGEITEAFDESRLKRYFEKGQKLCINGTVKTIEGKCKKAEEFIAFLSKKFNFDDSNIEIVQKINKPKSSGTSEEHRANITAEELDESSPNISVV
ncbi:MAG: hypothetical protein LBI69_04460 [Puniceicoccales bacterium]|nr:hypothetical protein [Puniceicoccales bacterium]